MSDFIIQIQFHNFNQISQVLLNFTGLTKVHNFGQIPNTISTNSDTTENKDNADHIESSHNADNYRILKI